MREAQESGRRGIVDPPAGEWKNVAVHFARRARGAAPRTFELMNEEIRFFQPGPVYVSAVVREAMTRPVVAHRSAEFMALYADLAERLPRLFATARPVFIVTGSSTLAMESAVVSTVERRVLNLTAGAFSERWHEISRALGKEADRISVPWGEAFDPELVRGALSRASYEAVTVVHNETSTGVIQPLAEIARVVREASDALILVDAVSSLAGAPVETDGWGLDVVVAGTQKAIAAPPGLALVAVSERAERAAEKVSRRGYYTDLLRYRDKHESGGTITTPAVSLVYALERAVTRVFDEGLERRFARHAGLARRTVGWAAEHGLEVVPRPAVRSPTVSCLRAPVGLTARALVRHVAERGWILGKGYGKLARTTFRIGHMGEVRDSDLEDLLTVLDEVMA